jgi:pseudouridine-5'-phosphate glycosidase
MPTVEPLRITPDTERALRAGRPVVALESAVITHGLPRTAALDAVRRQWTACEEAGAHPSVVAVYQGDLRVGLTLDECRLLAERTGAVKVSPWNLAATVNTSGFGGTTVAATVLAAALAGIRVVSTGGIGGVHRDGLDVSADLSELSRRQVCVVCAGPKSTLDAGATLERLETLGVPVIGWRSSLLAGFLAVSVGLRLPSRVDTIDALASLAMQHWSTGGAGLVVSQPLSGELAIAADELSADGEVAVRGPGRTPAELKQLQGRLGDRVIAANVALLERNASLAGSLAASLAQPAPAVARERGRIEPT